MDDPAAFQRALKETAQLRTPGQTDLGLRLHRHLLTLSVQNDAVSTVREFPVRNRSEDIDRAVAVVINPASLLAYLAAQHGPFVFAFPPAPGQPRAAAVTGGNSSSCPSGKTSRRPRRPS